MAVKEGELAQLAGLKAEWQGYRKLLSDVGVRLQKAKADFKDDLIASLNAFNDQVTGMRTDFLRNAPFDASVPPEKVRDSALEPEPGPEPEPDALGHWGIGALAHWRIGALGIGWGVGALGIGGIGGIQTLAHCRIVALARWGNGALGQWGIGALGPTSPLYLPCRRVSSSPYISHTYPLHLPCTSPTGARAHRGVPRPRRGGAHARGRDGGWAADLLDRP